MQRGRSCPNLFSFARDKIPEGKKGKLAVVFTVRDHVQFGW